MCPVAVTVPEPNTWREILAATEARPERKIAVQEYGRSSPELLEGLRARGAQVTTVPVYQWDLPEDTGPLREAARRLAAGQFDVAMFTTSIQILHLLRIAAEEKIEEQVRAALHRMVVASVGPTTSETLREHNLPVDFEPSHPKMGFLVGETSQRARYNRPQGLQHALGGPPHDEVHLSVVLRRRRGPGGCRRPAHRRSVTICPITTAMSAPPLGSCSPWWAISMDSMATRPTARRGRGR